MRAERVGNRQNIRKINIQSNIMKMALLELGYFGDDRDVKW